MQKMPTKQLQMLLIQFQMKIYQMKITVIIRIKIIILLQLKLNRRRNIRRELINNKMQHFNNAQMSI